MFSRTGPVGGTLDIEKDPVIPITHFLMGPAALISALAPAS
jgi:hypothetical protein